MMHGRNNGKKVMAVRIMKHTLEIIHLLTDANPIQIIVDAIINRYPLVLLPSLFLNYCASDLILVFDRISVSI
jgi:small subunit ribosomal protein S5e